MWLSTEPFMVLLQTLFLAYIWGGVLLIHIFFEKAIKEDIETNDDVAYDKYIALGVIVVIAIWPALLAYLLVSLIK